MAKEAAFGLADIRFAAFWTRFALVGYRMKQRGRRYD
jgi:hypothetical protein